MDTDSSIVFYGILITICYGVYYYLRGEEIMGHDEHEHGHHHHHDGERRREHGPGGKRSGTLCLAPGKSALCLVMPWKPSFVEWNYIKEYTDWNQFPSCNPTCPDQVSIAVVRLPTHDWGIEIDWDLHEAREIEWSAFRWSDDDSE